MDIHNKQIPRGRGIYLLPTFFTIMALFAGFYAIVSAMRGHFDDAAVSIFVAMLMDALDGRVARLTNTQSLFGAELDSLSDMVSFGLAPALIVYTWALESLGKFGWLAAFVFAVAVALRLARFNVLGGSNDKRYFRGLPCPSGAAVIAGMVWIGYDYGFNGRSLSIVVAAITILVALLMVSNLLYRSFKDLNFKDRVPFIVILVLVVLLVMIAIDPSQVLLAFFAFYALTGPLQWLLHKIKRAKRAIKINKIRERNKNT